MAAKNEKQVHLTRAELSIMQILWRSERPLCGPEIMAIIEKHPEGPAFSRSSYHVLINDLLAKEYIVAVSGRGHGKHQARAFAPTVTHNYYHAIQITSAELYHPSDIPDPSGDQYEQDKITSAAQRDGRQQSGPEQSP